MSNLEVFVVVGLMSWSITTIVLCIARLADRSRRWFR